MSLRSWLFLAGLAVVVLAAFVVARGFRGRADRACPRSFPQMELAALLTWDRGGWPEGMEPPQPGDLRPLADPQDSEVCGKLRELLPDSLGIGMLAAHSVAFYQAGDVYIAPVVPNLRAEEIEAIERGEFGAERHGLTYVVGSDYEILAVVEN